MKICNLLKKLMKCSAGSVSIYWMILMPSAVVAIGLVLSAGQLVIMHLQLSERGRAAARHGMSQLDIKGISVCGPGTTKDDNCNTFGISVCPSPDPSATTTTLASNPCKDLSPGESPEAVAAVTEYLNTSCPDCSVSSVTVGSDGLTLIVTLEMTVQRILLPGEVRITSTSTSKVVSDYMTTTIAATPDPALHPVVRIPGTTWRLEQQAHQFRDTINSNDLRSEFCGDDENRTELCTFTYAGVEYVINNLVVRQCSTRIRATPKLALTGPNALPSDSVLRFWAADRPGVVFSLPFIHANTSNQQWDLMWNRYEYQVEVHRNVNWNIEITVPASSPVPVIPARPARIDSLPASCKLS